MLKFALSLTLLLGLAGCGSDVEVVKDGVGVHLKNVKFEIKNLAEGTWKVGKLYRDTVTKNLTPVLGLPTFSDSDATFLRKRYQIDAWIIRVIQSNAQGSRIELVTLYAPFRGAHKGRTSDLEVKSVSFSLTYAAYAISERFRRFQCPAFSHDRRLKDFEVTGKSEPLEIVIRENGFFSEKIQMNELVPLSLNIGNSMVGEYSFEAALFSTSKRKIYSEFKRLPISVKVFNERSVSIDGCLGIHPEYEPVRQPSIPGRK